MIRPLSHVARRDVARSARYGAPINATLGDTLDANEAPANEGMGGTDGSSEEEDHAKEGRYG